MSFVAKYDGRCGSCDEAINAGDTVKYVEDVVCHHDCKDAEPEVLDRSKVCQSCWCVGKCDCA